MVSGEERSQGPECPICYEGKRGGALLRTRCGHHFHRRCLAAAVAEESRRLDRWDDGVGRGAGAGDERGDRPAHPSGWLAQTCPVCRRPLTSSSRTRLWNVLGGDPTRPLEERVPLNEDDVAGAIADAAEADDELALACMEWQGGITLLHLAAKRGLASRESVAALASSSDLEARTHAGGGGKTPFVEAAWAGHLDLCRFLRELGADCGAVDDQGAGALVAAVYTGRDDLLDWMLTLPGTSVHQRLVTNGATLLYMAAEQGRTHMAKELIRLGADVNAVLSDFTTPLWVACREGHEEVVEVLLSAGASIHCGQTFTGNVEDTALWIATYHNRASIVARIEQEIKLLRYRGESWETQLCP